MPASSEFADFVTDCLAPLGPVRAKRMFGGHGIFYDDRMFGLIFDDTLYLRVDDGNRPDFEAADLPAFTYAQRGREVTLPYHEAPAEALDDPDTLLDWAREALAAALRSPLS
ncbi:competence-specific genes regulator [Salinisphaera sp. PC39]|uniref:TfoX/Sxy family protein n=1 Tax=Salinisphaera sp. PC39 TaxID=1304156 RepID=UPI00333E9557